MFFYTTNPIESVIDRTDVLAIPCSWDGKAYYGDLRHIKDTYPAVYKVYQDTCAARKADGSRVFKLGHALNVRNGDKMFVFLCVHRFFSDKADPRALDRAMGNLRHLYDTGKLDEVAKKGKDGKWTLMIAISQAGLLTHAKFTWDQVGRMFASSGLAHDAKDRKGLILGIMRNADQAAFPVLDEEDEDEVDRKRTQPLADVKEASEEEVTATQQSSFRLSNLPDFVIPDVLEIVDRHATAKLNGTTVKLDDEPFAVYEDMEALARADAALDAQLASK